MNESVASAVRFRCRAAGWLLAAGVCGLVVQAAPAAQPPTLYELLINGESFLVEANRAVTLESRQQPGVKYQVALRIAPVQPVRLLSCRFEYELPATLHAESAPQAGGAARRSARLTHELGFDLLLTDLGGPLKPGAHAEALKILSDSVMKTFKQMGVDALTAAAPHQRRFAHCEGHGVVIHYLDEQGIGHTSLAYVLGNERFAATCVVQYLDKDSQDVLPLIKRALDSLRPLE